MHFQMPRSGRKCDELSRTRAVVSVCGDYKSSTPYYEYGPRHIFLVNSTLSEHNIETLLTKGHCKTKQRHFMPMKIRYK